MLGTTNCGHDCTGSEQQFPLINFGFLAAAMVMLESSLPIFEWLVSVSSEDRDNGRA
jgi:hypothetical protein